jgi:hypothetical protein
MDKQTDLFPALLEAATEEMRAAHPYEPETLDQPFEDAFDEEDDLNTDLENLHEQEADARGYWCTLDEATVVEEDMYHYAGDER